ncbi:hypothetical protein PM082_016601 [Marasmius tenuissimus]|nr:hypothetical protein PM082_016601 [Marasmius tenuissimus]
MSHVRQSLLINLSLNYHHCQPVIAGNDELNTLLIYSNVLNAQYDTRLICDLPANFVPMPSDILPAARDS